MPSEGSKDQAAPSPSHRNNFSLVRLYLAFGVFLGHYSWVFPQGGVPGRFAVWLVGEDGLNAVRAFFIISGFFMFRSYGASASLGSYLRKRADRVLPAYFTVILASAALGYFLTSASASDYFSADLLKYVFWNSLFLNFVHPTLPGLFQDQPIHLVNSSLWTLKIEVSFYLSVPIIVWVSRRVKTPVLFGALYAASVAYAAVFDHLFQTTGRPIYHTLSLQLPGQLCYFLSGALIEHYRPLFNRQSRPLIAVAAVTILLSYLLAIDVFYPIALAVVIIAICTLTPYLGNWERFGDLSYSTYIYHFPILQTFAALGLLAPATSPLHLVAVVATVLAVACLSWNLVESRFLKKRLQGSTAQPSSELAVPFGPAT